MLLEVQVVKLLIVQVMLKILMQVQPVLLVPLKILDVPQVNVVLLLRRQHQIAQLLIQINLLQRVNVIVVHQLMNA